MKTLFTSLLMTVACIAFSQQTPCDELVSYLIKDNKPPFGSTREAIKIEVDDNSWMSVEFNGDTTTGVMTLRVGGKEACVPPAGKVKFTFDDNTTLDFKPKNKDCSAAVTSIFMDLGFPMDGFMSMATMKKLGIIQIKEISIATNKGTFKGVLSDEAKRKVQQSVACILNSGT